MLLTQDMATPAGKRKREFQDENFENFTIVNIPCNIKRRKTENKSDSIIKVCTVWYKQFCVHDFFQLMDY